MFLYSTYLIDLLCDDWSEKLHIYACMHAYMKSFTICVVGVLKVYLFLDSSSPI